jgi:DNA modification methylase
MNRIKDESIDLVVTSPPYPMISMWDGLFSSISPAAKNALENNDGNGAFDAMHVELDKVWCELYRVLKKGAFACINIGDAVRTIGDRFQLYPNHSRIINSFRAVGFDCMPVIIWRKQTNAPNKFMGSGMLPAGAYVTLEHEYILIFRKGAKRKFSADSEKSSRMRSSFFWEERNRWFSDIWDFKGIPQALNNPELRKRSAAYPLELACRLINMYSLYEETVLDPFLGTGTTMLASIACARNSIGFEIDKAFSSFVPEYAVSSQAIADDLLSARISGHNEFVSSYMKSKGPMKYINGPHGFPVVTRQETGIQLYRIREVVSTDALLIQVLYEPVGRLGDISGMDTFESLIPPDCVGKQLNIFGQKDYDPVKKKRGKT